jgi:hypothetical protein
MQYKTVSDKYIICCVACLLAEIDIRNGDSSTEQPKAAAECERAIFILL